MTKLIETAAMALGGLSLLAVSFVAFTVFSGTPLDEVAVLSKLLHGQDAATEPPTEPVEVAPSKPRSNTDVVETTLGSLGAWTLPSPFTENELQTLTDELKTKLQRLDLRQADQDRREEELDADRKTVAERFDSLESMQKDLEAFKAELKLREQEVLRDEAAASERATARWTDVGRVIAALEDEAAGRRLSSFPPEDAARILLSMEPTRAAEILNQLEGDSWKDYVEAYTDLRAASGKGS